jgi:predicted PolB exonuclease-like 3'-5' exonuclease
MPASEPARTAFLIVDTETIPDGSLVAAVKYPGEEMTPEAAIERAKQDARDNSKNSLRNPDFLPVTFQIPVAASVLRVGSDFTLQALACLDAPHFRTHEIVKKFWLGYAHYFQESKAKLVTFNGRRFDMPLLELAAYRYGIPARDYFQSSRNRYNGPIDLCDWFSNFGACYMDGGLNLLAKMLGLPGKQEMKGEDVYPKFLEGKLQEINDYCLCDTLDTYFVFLRTRILTGDISPDQEEELRSKARALLESKTEEFAVLERYLEAWKGVEE